MCYIFIQWQDRGNGLLIINYIATQPLYGLDNEIIPKQTANMALKTVSIHNMTAKIASDTNYCVCHLPNACDLSSLYLGFSLVLVSA